MHTRNRIFLLTAVISLLLTVAGMHLYLEKAAYLSWQQESLSMARLARVWAMPFTEAMEQHSTIESLSTLVRPVKQDGIVRLTLETHGKQVFNYQREPSDTIAPAWFVWYVKHYNPSFVVAEVIAPVASGRGYLRLATDNGPLYDRLWLDFYSVAGYFLAANLLLLVIFRILLGVLLSPLTHVVRTAEAALNNRFERIPDSAAIAEFRVVVMAYNTMLDRLLASFEAGSVRAGDQQREWLVDPLTALHNRRSFYLFLDQLTEDKVGTAVTVLLVICLQKLDRYNRQFGILEGDALLIDVANLLRHHVGHQAWVTARVSGSMFAVIVSLQESHIDNLLNEYQQCHVQLMAMMAHVGCGDDSVTVSSGIACFDATVSRDKLIQHVERLIHDVPELEKNQCVVFELDQSEARRHWRPILREAIAKRSWVLFAAPVVDLVSGAVLHTELLARLVLENDRFVTACEFLPHAVREDLIIDVERSIMACCFATLFSAVPMPLPLAINLGEHFIKDKVAFQWLEHRLYELGEHAQQLCFEVSEGTLLRHEAASMALRELLHSVGAHFGVDHFGVDIRALELIRRWEPNYLKLVGGLVHDACHDTAAASLISSICSIATTLGITVIGLHIEKEEHAEAVKQLGVRGAQGYLFGSPARIG